MYDVDPKEDIVQMTYEGRAYGTPTAMLHGKAPLSAYDVRAPVMRLDRPDVQSRMITTSPMPPQQVIPVSHVITGGQPCTTGISPTEVKTRGVDETWYPGMLMSKGITAILIIGVIAITAWAAVTIYTNYVSAKTLKEGGITTTETVID